MADVPVRCLLSGGVDSSLIVGLLAEAGQHGLKTFSIGFESVGGVAGDEFRWSDIITRRFDTDHQQIDIDTDQRRGLANHEPQPTAAAFVDFLFPGQPGLPQAWTPEAPPLSAT